MGLAREGGSAALTVRAATRAVGVSPSASYRHFADQHDLVIAVAQRAQAMLAASMLDWMERLGPGDEPRERAVTRLRGVGLGYIAFALAEPGLFEVAFVTDDEPPDPTDAHSPFGLLISALDEMAAAGVLTGEQRANAEWVCWSSVHGFTDLVARGPLRELDSETVEALGRHVVDTVITGLSQPGAVSGP